MVPLSSACGSIALIMAGVTRVGQAEYASKIPKTD